MRLSCKRPAPSPYVFGRAAGRRREEAVGAAQHSSKVSTSWQVVPVEAQRCTRCFRKRDAQISNAALEENAESTGSSHSSQPSCQHDIENTGQRRLENHNRHRAKEFGMRHLLGAHNIPLRKYVNSRKPKNEVVRLERRNIDVSLQLIVDDVMDMLIESTPGRTGQTTKKTHARTWKSRMRA